MRAPRRKRPLRRAISAVPPGIDLAKVAEEAVYVGSSEHKSFPSFAGPPKLRSDATRCDPSFDDVSVLTEELRKAIRRGQVGAPWEGSFPRYAWARIDHDCYEARLVNSGNGQYKGYPLHPSECPGEI